MERLLDALKPLCCQLRKALQEQSKDDSFRATAEYQQREDFAAAVFRYTSAVMALENCFLQQTLDRPFVIEHLKAVEGHLDDIQVLGTELTKSPISWSTLGWHTDGLNQKAVNLAKLFAELHDKNDLPTNSSPEDVALADIYIFWFLRFSDSWQKKRHLATEVWPHVQKHLYLFGYQLNFEKEGYENHKESVVCMQAAFCSVFEPWRDVTPVLDFIQAEEWNLKIQTDPTLKDQILGKVAHTSAECSRLGITKILHLRDAKIRRHVDPQYMSADVKALIDKVPPKREYIQLEDFKFFMLRFGPFPKLLMKFCTVCQSTGDLLEKYIADTSGQRISAYLYFHPEVQYVVRPSGHKPKSFTRQVIGVKTAIRNTPDGFVTDVSGDQRRIVPRETLCEAIEEYWGNNDHPPFSAEIQLWRERIASMELGPIEEYFKLKQSRKTSAEVAHDEPPTVSNLDDLTFVYSKSTGKYTWLCGNCIEERLDRLERVLPVPTGSHEPLQPPRTQYDTHLETKFDSAPSGSSAEAFGDTEFTGGVVNDEEKTDHCVMPPHGSQNIVANPEFAPFNSAVRRARAVEASTTGASSPAPALIASPPAKRRLPKCKGTTVVKIIEAKDLPNVEVLNLKGDKSDPFVQFWFGALQNDSKKARTKVINNDLTPRWDHLHREIRTEFRDIHFEVWDHNNVRSHAFMGASCISRRNLKPTAEDGVWSFKDWVRLGSTSRRRNGKLIDCSNAKGQIYVEVTFEADEEDD